MDAKLKEAFEYYENFRKIFFDAYEELSSDIEKYFQEKNMSVDSVIKENQCELSVLGFDIVFYPQDFIKDYEKGYVKNDVKKLLSNYIVSTLFNVM